MSFCIETCIRSYGLTHFKIKISGEAAADIERLRRLARIIGDEAGPESRFTLDANEQYEDIGSFRELWESLEKDDSLREFLDRILFVEQPLRRDISLTEAVRGDLLAWKTRPPMIIDEADSLTESLPTALRCGYSGTSHKNCKGVFKGIANACLIEQRNRRDPAGRYLMSGEDLANIGPVALLQDLAVMATLGVEHVERNGHHYFAGLSMFSEEVQLDALRGHFDLFRESELGWPTLRIKSGWIDIGSVVSAPFGCAFDLDLRQFTPVDEWRGTKLGMY